MTRAHPAARDLSFWATAAPEGLFAAVTDAENRGFTRSVLDRLRPDPIWTGHIASLIDAGNIEIRSLLSWLARRIEPVNYLEVGVRRGFSMAMVAARWPNVTIYGFDLWIPGYGGVESPGPRFVRAELRRVGHRGPVHLLSGNSHQTLAAFLGLNRASRRQRIFSILRYGAAPSSFDLITIDGDHSLLGAYQDLTDTMPFCAVGGAVVFDDISPDLAAVSPEAVRAERGEDPHGWGDLLGVWRAIQREFPEFRYFEYSQNPPGVGLAVRMR